MGHQDGRARVGRRDGGPIMSKRDFFATSAFVALLAAGGMAPGAAFAQGAAAAKGASLGAGDARVDEVIVTAQKREERLQDVPVSIAAATEQMLADQSIVSLTELDTVAPGLTFFSNPGRFGSGPSIALRGVTTQTQSAGVQDSVGLVLDGVVISRGKAGAFPDLSDVAQVEILRGPQGTLFGKNASAGVISITTKDPTPELNAAASYTYATHNTQIARVSASGPIVADRLLGRISVYKSSRDGYVRSIADNQTFEKDDQTGGRIKLLYTPSAEDDFRLSADFVRQKNDGGAAVPRILLPTSPAYLVPYLAPLIGDGVENDKVNNRAKIAENVHKSGGLSLEWNRRLQGHTLTTVAAWRYFSQDYEQEDSYGTLTPIDRGHQKGFHKLHQYSLEARIASTHSGPLQYVVGAFAFADKNNVGTRFPRGILSLPANIVLGRNYISDTKSRNAALFGEANYKLLDGLTLIAGGRLAHEKGDVIIDGFPIPEGQVRNGHPVGRTVDSAEVDKLSWKTGLQWRMAPDVMLYGTYSTGFKGPGFNVNTSVLGDAQPVKSELVESFEAGVKASFWDRRVAVNLAAFSSDFTDFQTQGTIFPNGVTNPGQIVLLNAGAMRSRGFEWEVQVRPLPRMELSFNGAYIDAKFTDFANAPCYTGQVRGAGRCSSSGTQNLDGFPLPNTPEWSYNLFAKQGFDAPLGLQGYVTVDYSWRDTLQWDVLQSPFQLEKGYGLLGASIGLVTADGRLEAKLFAKNLTDKFHTSGVQGTNQFLPPTYTRFIGIELAVRY
ncbi:MAG: hypothetical protein B7Y99_08605 [Caulobacterales bacterium 32-69-10]|nr:MAG: hypothetical protein B7Y99_08605 [Caulobacterales bacterium 32-69-10]